MNVIPPKKERKTVKCSLDRTVHDQQPEQVPRVSLRNQGHIHSEHLFERVSSLPSSL